MSEPGSSTPFVMTSVSPFALRTALQGEASSLASGLHRNAVRRPLRGIQVKADTFATMSVISASGVGGSLANSSVHAATDGGVGSASYTSNFILVGSREERSEKFQSLSTFGAAYGFFFGEQPRFVSYQAVLMNTADFQWELEWWYNYENTLRGTALVEKNARVYLYYDEVTVEGYIITASTQKSATTPHEVGLSFTMWVTNVQTVQTPGATMDSRENGTFFVDTQKNPTGGLVSTTAAVRAKNIAAYSKRSEGLLGGLRSAINSVSNFTGKVGAALDDAKNFLYGRTLVFPAGYAGAERYSGSVDTTSGLFTSADAASIGGVLSQLTGAPVVLRLPAPMALPPTLKAATQYHYNYDEYVNREFSDAYADVKTNVEGLLKPGSTREQRTLEAIDAATAMFAVNHINVNNDMGSGLPPGETLLLGIVGRATFGVVSFVAMEAAAPLTGTKTTATVAATKLAKAEKIEAARTDAQAERIARAEANEATRTANQAELEAMWEKAGG